MVQLLSAEPGLSPKTDHFSNGFNLAQDDQTVAVLLCLFGTIVTRYKGAQYNIPVVFWIPRQYPQQGPTVLVVPTDEMVIKPSTHVDHSGRIYHPFLAFWHQRPQSTLMELNLMDLA